MKNGSLILRGLIATFVLLVIGAFVAPSHFGLLGNCVEKYNPVTLVLDYIDYEDCQTGRMHEEGVCEALRKKY